MSKYNHGWQYKPTIEGIGGALLHECRSMLHASKRIASLSSPETFVARKEDLTRDLRVQLLQVAEQLHLNLTMAQERIGAVLTDLSAHKFASFGKPPAKLKVTQEQALAWVRAHSIEGVEHDDAGSVGAAVNNSTKKGSRRSRIGSKEAPHVHQHMHYLDPCQRAYQHFGYLFPDISSAQLGQ